MVHHHHHQGSGLLSYKAQAKCEGFDLELVCVRKDCEWVETNDPSDCVLTTTSSPGCCASTTANAADKCNQKLSREQCEHLDACYFVEGGDVDEDCAWVTSARTGAAPGARRTTRATARWP